MRRRSICVCIAFAAFALALAGCGGGSSKKTAPVDRGGFTTSERSLAQKALDTLRRTSIPGTIIQLTATIGLPAVCRVHAADANDFDVILAWKPIPRSGNAFTWFRLAVGQTGVIPASMDLGIAPDGSALRTHYGVAYTRPFDPCRINAYGWLTAVPLTFGELPSTGHALKVPNQGSYIQPTKCSLCVQHGH